MQIDWFTVSAQILNFLVLVYLLKRFLYGPIVAAMERREQGIAERIHEAEARERAAEEARLEFQDERRSLDAQREALLAQARREVEAQRAEMVAALRLEVDRLGVEWRRDVEREKAVFLKEVRAAVGRQAAAIARRTLEGLAGVGLEQRIMVHFSEALGALPEAERQTLVRGAGAGLTVATAFELDGDAREAVLARLRDVLGTDVRAEFRRRPELICGIALEIPGHTWVWGVDSYLGDLESELSDVLLHSSAGAGASPGERRA